MTGGYVCSNTKCLTRRDNMGVCMLHATCAEGIFRERIRAHVGDLGRWTFRNMAGFGNVPPTMAMLRGTRGRVEVIGGFVHANEVWFVAKDKTETLVARHWEPATLREAVLAACSLAGVQLPLEASL